MHHHHTGADAHRAASRRRMERLSAASPLEQVVLTYEETIQAIDETIEAIDRGAIEARFNASVRAMDLIDHLASCIDETRGGDVARNLGQVYRAVMLRLGRVNPFNDRGAAIEARDLLAPLLESWRTLLSFEDRLDVSTDAAPLPVPPGAVAARVIPGPWTYATA